MSGAEIELGEKPGAKTEKKSNAKLFIGIGVVVLIVAAAVVVGLGFGLGLFSPGGLIKGTWESNYGTAVTVTSTHWYAVSSWSTTVYDIKKLTNSYAIMQNPSTAAYNPSKFTKNEFHALPDGKWGFCSSVYDADTAEAAESKDTSATYTSTNAATGCNGFPHTVMSKATLSIAGKWSTNYGSTLTISESEWKSESSYGNSVHQILGFGKNFVLMQNPADDQYNPSKWTKVEFHTSGADFGFCMSVYSGETAGAALTTDTSTIYNKANATAGCNGFPHTIASPA